MIALLRPQGRPFQPVALHEADGAVKATASKARDVFCGRKSAMQHHVVSERSLAVAVSDDDDDLLRLLLLLTPLSHIFFVIISYHRQSKVSK
jgi:1,2-phenylacetyl-CoA epoxidase PaaB subunit